MVLFIDAVDELLSEKGLGFVTNIINIAFIVLLAILITKGVRRLMQRLRSSRCFFAVLMGSQRWPLS